MKLTKELKAGIIALLAIGLLVTGVNFLKGYSFFGGDDEYTAYFPNSGGLGAATSVYLNGVIVGKVLTVEYNAAGDSLSKVKVIFTINDSELRIPKGSKVEIGSFDLFNKGVLLNFSQDISKGYYSEFDKIQGTVAADMMSQVKAYADPITQKLQTLMGNVDKTITSLKGFWDTTATSEIKGSLLELKTAIHRFGDLAIDVEGLVETEKVKLSRIMSNVESITGNLKASNEKVTKILGNFEKISDDLVTADFKKTISNANATLEKLNEAINAINNGDGTVGKLLKDDKLYNELVQTNKSLQNLVEDLELHPERYIHFSVFGAKSKGVPLTKSDEKKLKKVLDSIPD